MLLYKSYMLTLADGGQDRVFVRFSVLNENSVRKQGPDVYVMMKKQFQHAKAAKEVTLHLVGVYSAGELHSGQQHDMVA